MHKLYQKKIKGKEITFQRPSFWLGIHALNLLAQENNQPMEPSHSVSHLVRIGVSHDEALDCIIYYIFLDITNLS